MSYLIFYGLAFWLIPALLMVGIGELEHRFMKRPRDGNYVFYGLIPIVNFLMLLVVVFSAIFDGGSNVLKKLGNKYENIGKDK